MCPKMYPTGGPGGHSWEAQHLRSSKVQAKSQIVVATRLKDIDDLVLIRSSQLIVPQRGLWGPS